MSSLLVRQFVNEFHCAEKSELQRLLAARGLYNGEIDGRFGQASRDAIHRFQISIDAYPADGYGSQEVLRRLKEDSSDSRP